MAKHLGEHEPVRPLTKEERAARKEFRQVEADMAMIDHETAQAAFKENRERLRAERLAREQAEPLVPITKANKNKTVV